MTIENNPSRPRPSVLVTLLVLAGTVVFMSVFLGLYKLLGIGAPYMGVLFLLYWAAMLHMDFSTYLPSVVGAMIGTVLAWMLIALPVTAGLAGATVAYGALGVLLFCYTRSQAGLVANNAALLFVLVGSIPELGVTRNILHMVLSVVLAAVFMGGVAWLIQWVRHRRVDRPAVPAI